MYFADSLFRLVELTDSRLYVQGRESVAMPLHVVSDEPKAVVQIGSRENALKSLQVVNECLRLTCLTLVTFNQFP